MNSLHIADEIAERVRVRVPAKINLSLRVGPLRDDGFHDLSTIFQAVSLFDIITAHVTPDATISVQMEGEGADLIDDGFGNLAVRAARLLRERFGRLEAGAHLKIRKAIPVAGGMAGGSADAAGALVACAALWRIDVTPDEFHTMAAELGSDVPFSFLGGTALGRGRGDALFPLLSRGSYHWVLAFAEGGLSTPAVFRRFDEMVDAGCNENGLASEHEMINALASADVREVARLLWNDLAAPAIDLYPELAAILEAGRQSGALAGIVSGSGPTCAFLCADETDALGVLTGLRSVPGVRDVCRASGPVAGARIIG